MRALTEPRKMEVAVRAFYPIQGAHRERERERGEGEGIEHCIDVLYDGKQRVVGAAAVVEEDNKQIVRSYIQITLMGKSGRE